MSMQSNENLEKNLNNDTEMKVRDSVNKSIHKIQNYAEKS